MQFGSEFLSPYHYEGDPDWRAPSTWEELRKAVERIAVAGMPKGGLRPPDVWQAYRKYAASHDPATDILIQMNGGTPCVIVNRFPYLRLYERLLPRLAISGQTVEHVCVWNKEELAPDMVETALRAAYPGLLDWCGFAHPWQIRTVKTIPHYHAFVWRDELFGLVDFWRQQI